MCFEALLSQFYLVAEDLFPLIDWTGDRFAPVADDTSMAPVDPACAFSKGLSEPMTLWDVVETECW